MAVWQPSAGATLLIPSGPTGNHLFVVLCDPTRLPGYGPRPCVVLVSVSSVRQGLPHDPTCVLQPGCHPFVQNPSYVRYRDARIDRADDLVERVAQRVFVPHDPMPQAQFASIRAGLRVSPFVKREIKLLPI